MGAQLVGSVLGLAVRSFGSVAYLADSLVVRTVHNWVACWDATLAIHWVAQ